MALFRPFAEKSARWRPVEGNGIEHLTARKTGASIVVRSVVIGGLGGRPYGAYYRIECDTGWAVRMFEIETTDERRLCLQSDGRGRWQDEQGRAIPQFDGCLDIDLAGSPFTNTLPIRRLDLDVDRGPVELSMLFVPFDDFVPVMDGQRYTCLESGRRYRFEEIDESFAADLTVDKDGFVTDYPGLFTRAN